MNKYFRTFMTAMVVFSSGFLISCGDDDGPIKEEPKQPTIQYAHYRAVMHKDFFDYGDVTLTLIHDGDTTYYKMDESTVVDNIADDPSINALFDIEIGDNLPGRMIDLPIEFNVHPVKALLKVELNEAGRQKVANASGDEKLGYFYLASSLQEHAKDKCYCVYYETEVIKDTPVKNLEGFLESYNEYHKSVLVKELK